MLLTEPTLEYAEQIMVYRQAFLDCGDSMDGTQGLRSSDTAEKWIRYAESCKRPETVPEGLVTATQFIFVREEDRKIVGMIQIRHCLNDFLLSYGGHIGYSVAPDERRKGYATQMLAMTLPVCRELGIDRALITCLKDNEGSRRTILKNGGIYENTVYEPDEGVYIERYRIDLT